MKYFVATLLLLTAFSISQAQPKVVSNLIGEVHKEHLPDGCGGTYEVSNRIVSHFGTAFNVKSTVFAGDMVSGWMNIDGQDVKLILVNQTPSSKVEIRKGLRLIQNYTASDGAKIKIETLVTRGPSDNYEGSDYVGTITVNKGGRRQTVKVVGSFGC